MENLSGTSICPQCGAELKWAYCPRTRMSGANIFPAFDCQEGFCAVENITHDENGRSIPYFTCPECGYKGSFHIPAE